ncbi:MAG: UDP-N-acetylmuramate dehydrogenase [Flavobacteriales bacterium]|nr:UDP-N-acetylmuramate dehydrogenase [Flavobacteriales bacterium]MCB9335543.1 UDP-N-acetylmuramate dehydrogenase [Flavobacteriales bacterium]
MSLLQQNTSLKPYNTFGVDVNSSFFTDVSSVNNLKQILQKNIKPLLILGGGSNILLTKNFNGLVVKNNIRGIDLLDDTENDVVLKVGSGENWHQFVMYCIDHGYCGVENLSLIPGSVGASPMQNIGAYGVEVKDLIEEVEVLDLKNFSIKTFKNSECEFGYRTSIFKTSHKDKYFITAVTFRLSKKPNLNTSYGAIESELMNRGITKPSIKDVSDAVIAIRQSKLPDPAKIGNSGSFFKNPIVTVEELKNIQNEYENVPNYLQEDGTYKIAAGWLIEQCGWKGKKIEDYGVHDKQALVLVNYGGATGQQIYQLSDDIINSVKEKFNVTLEREVNII